ncbi:putative lipid II flippase FtsW [Marinicrinis sediminis]|uniref:Probable peptidoglycan glycosyltransferase FtsW n=1 Tax=Marinicrinis sediminis TaxID=1652465 RepID=A0ABW5R5E3_9BACL
MKSTHRGTPDFILLILTFLLTGFGVVMVFSASSPIGTIDYGDAMFFTKRQLVFFVLGTFSMLIVMNIPYTVFRKWFFLAFLGVVFLLIVVLFTAPINGAKSWIRFGSIGLQPSEFAKLAVILYLAALVSKKGDKIRNFKKGLLPALVIVGFMAALVMLQPDFGTAMILIISSLIVIVAGGASLKQLFAAGTVVTAPASLLLGLYFLLNSTELGYRFSRITTYMDPWSDRLGSGMQIINSLFAFGHGGLTGAGFGQSIQKLHYLPEAHNDFIFAIIGEELGFIGILIFLLLYLGMLWRALIISLRCKDTFGSLLGTGIVGLIAVQAFINMGGVTNLIPMTGVTLPFISYGGSSLLVSMISMGMILSISRHHTAKNEK